MEIILGFMVLAFLIVLINNAIPKWTKCPTCGEEYRKGSPFCPSCNLKHMKEVEKEIENF